MTTTEINPIKLDVQLTGVKMNDYLDRKIQGLIRKLQKTLPAINWIDIYLKAEPDAEIPRMVNVRVGIPGPDVVASDRGQQWKQLLRNVEKRLMRQLEKRKSLLAKAVV
ncbi:30S ribosomal protein S30 [Flavisolibacter sp. BT320]|nr:30S ribosomal protein S30 [Flavisolibacter longurius]